MEEEVNDLLRLASKCQLIEQRVREGAALKEPNVKKRLVYGLLYGYPGIEGVDAQALLEKVHRRSGGVRWKEYKEFVGELVEGKPQEVKVKMLMVEMSGMGEEEVEEEIEENEKAYCMACDREIAGKMVKYHRKSKKHCRLREEQEKEKEKEFVVLSEERIREVERRYRRLLKIFKEEIEECFYGRERRERREKKVRVRKHIFYIDYNCGLCGSVFRGQKLFGRHFREEGHRKALENIGVRVSISKELKKYDGVTSRAVVEKILSTSSTSTSFYRDMP